MQYEKSKRKIKKIIEGMAGKYRAYNIFKDFIVLSACTISNSVDKQQWQRREKMYMETIKKYTRDEANKFAEMLALMILAYERRMGDFIGELYMTMEFGNDDTGQHFTPYHISKMMAKLTGYNKKDGVISFNDPACGSGGLVVAYADRKSTRLNSSHVAISYAVFCLKKKSNGNGAPSRPCSHRRVNDRDRATCA